MCVKTEKLELREIFQDRSGQLPYFQDQETEAVSGLKDFPSASLPGRNRILCKATASSAPLLPETQLAGFCVTVLAHCSACPPSCAFFPANGTSFPSSSLLKCELLHLKCSPHQKGNWIHAHHSTSYVTFLPVLCDFVLCSTENCL